MKFIAFLLLSFLLTFALAVVNIRRPNTRLRKSDRAANKTSKAQTPVEDQGLYKDMEYLEIVNKIEAISKLPSASRILRVETAQKLYNLPSPGNCKGKPCLSHVLFITSLEVSDQSKPQILLSGALHGDERPGPNAIVELAEILVRNYEKDPWVTHLVNTRVIIIVPTANSQGYCNRQRGELIDGVEYDPNRDFPYTLETCMNTAAARVIYSLFAKNLISLAITFHSGDHSITYPWGSNNHLLKEEGPDGQELATESPDRTALSSAVKIMQKFADSGTKRFPKFVIGEISNVVYSVSGGMEDWAYAAGWENKVFEDSNKDNRHEKKPVTTCNPKTYGGYNDFSKLDMSHQRCATFLVEASKDKSPERPSLGRRSDLCILKFNPNVFHLGLSKEELEDCSKNDGYIAQNIRNSLAIIEMVEPYVHVSSIDINSKVTIKWNVGGAQDVDETFVLWATAEEITKRKVEAEKFFNFSTASTGSPLNSVLVHQPKNLEETLAKLKIIFPHKTESKKAVGSLNFERRKNPGFFVENLPTLPGGVYFIVVAKTDQEFAKQLKPDPQVKPQTHFVNTRTDPKYYINYPHLGFSTRSCYYVFSKFFHV